jgi:hypothetical protein
MITGSWHCGATRFEIDAATADVFVIDGKHLW